MLAPAYAAIVPAVASAIEYAPKVRGPLMRAASILEVKPSPLSSINAIPTVALPNNSKSRKERVFAGLLIREVDTCGEWTGADHVAAMRRYLRGPQTASPRVRTASNSTICFVNGE